MRIAVAVALLLALGTFLVARGSGADRHAASDGVLLGAYVSPDGHAWSRTGVTALEQRLGRTLAIDHRFQHWDDAFPTAADGWDLAHGRTPMITWEPDGPSLAAIADGAVDARLRDRARAVAREPGTVLLRFAHEMNTDWYAWAGARSNTPGTHDGPAHYVAAWRHVHAVFVAEGATNVRWVWSPNHRSIPAADWNAAARYYPGDDVVDWIGVDGYDRVPGRRQPFAAVFGATLAMFGHRKPVMIAETATDRRGDPTGAAAWIAAARAAIVHRFPTVRAVVWFDADKRGHGWRVDTGGAPARAFRALARDPAFGGRIGG